MITVSRPDLADLSNKLKALGGTEVLTYDDLADRTLTSTIMKDWTSGKVCILALTLCCIFILCNNREFGWA